MTRKRDEAKVAEARRLHGLGLTTTRIAKLLEVDPTTVQRWTRDLARPAGRPKRPDVPDDLVTELRDQAGLSYEQMAAETRMSKTGIRNRYYSLTGRERPERRKQAVDGGPEHATQTTTGETL